MDIFTPEKRSEIMRNIPNKNTAPELKLRRALYALGLRYRLHARKLLGKPDIVFSSQRVVVFVDGDWWHGRNFERDAHKYTEFWRNKINANIARDEKVSEGLKMEGWHVYRYWQKDIEKDVITPAKEIMMVVNRNKSLHS